MLQCPFHWTDIDLQGTPAGSMKPSTKCVVIATISSKLCDAMRRQQKSTQMNLDNLSLGWLSRTGSTCNIYSHASTPINTIPLPSRPPSPPSPHTFLPKRHLELIPQRPTPLKTNHSFPAYHTANREVAPVAATPACGTEGKKEGMDDCPDFRFLRA